MALRFPSRLLNAAGCIVGTSPFTKNFSNIRFRWYLVVGILLVIRRSTVVADAVLEFVGGDEAVGISLVIRSSTVVAEPVLWLELVVSDEAVEISIVVGTSLDAETVLGLVVMYEVVGISFVVRKSAVVVESVL